MRNGKWTKVPYSPHTGHEAKADDPRTWNTRSAAEIRARNIVNGQGGGIGIELGDLGDGYSLGGVDLDTCRSPGGKLEEWAVDVIRRFKSYTEVSPSEMGVKILFKYHTADLEKLRPALDGAKTGKQFKRGDNKDHPPGIEVYLCGRYFAITEQPLEWLPNEIDVPDEIVGAGVEDLLWLLTDFGPTYAAGGRWGQGERQQPGQLPIGKGLAARREDEARGRTFEEMCEALRTDPETAEWYREQGNSKRQFERSGTSRSRP